MNINESTWTSTAISDAQVVITAGMQGQCVFSEGDSNSIAVNLTALAQLKWDPSALKMKETVRQVAKKNKNYTFQIFDLSTGYYTSVNLEKMTKLNRARFMTGGGYRLLSSANFGELVLGCIEAKIGK